MMQQFGVNKMIFSSTAAVYGVPKYLPIDENHPLKPINFYGFTKLKIEKLPRWIGWMDLWIGWMDRMGG